MRNCIFALAALLVAVGVVQAEDRHPATGTFVPRWLCICPPTDCKPLPGVCWDWKQCCGQYCKKPMPCVEYPCLKCGPCYDCKPAPRCYPCPLCPAEPRCWP